LGEFIWPVNALVSVHAALRVRWSCLRADLVLVLDTISLFSNHTWVQHEHWPIFHVLLCYSSSSVAQQRTLIADRLLVLIAGGKLLLALGAPLQRHNLSLSKKHTIMVSRSASGGQTQQRKLDLRSLTVGGYSRVAICILFRVLKFHPQHTPRFLITTIMISYKTTCAFSLRFKHAQASATAIRSFFEVAAKCSCGHVSKTLKRKRALPPCSPPAAECAPFHLIAF
jgi:hypothetical protein